MARIVRAFLYAYCGAVLAGLLVAVVAVGFGLAPGTVMPAAAVTGMVFGVSGFTLPWLRPMVAARSRRDTH